MDDYEINWYLEGVGTNEQIQITRSPFHVGRDKSMDLICRSVNISRNHADILVYIDKSLHIKENRAINGTFINQQLIARDTIATVNEGDEIGFGSHSGVNIANGIQVYIYIARRRAPVIIEQPSLQMDVAGGAPDIIQQPSLQVDVAEGAPDIIEQPSLQMDVAGGAQLEVGFIQPANMIKFEDPLFEDSSETFVSAGNSPSDLLNADVQDNCNISLETKSAGRLLNVDTESKPEHDQTVTKLSEALKCHTVQQDNKYECIGNEQHDKKSCGSPHSSSSSLKSHTVQQDNKHGCIGNEQHDINNCVSSHSSSSDLLYVSALHNCDTSMVPHVLQHLTEINTENKVDLDITTANLPESMQHPCVRGHTVNEQNSVKKFVSAHCQSSNLLSVDLLNHLNYSLASNSPQNLREINTENNPGLLKHPTVGQYNRFQYLVDEPDVIETPVDVYCSSSDLLPVDLLNHRNISLAPKLSKHLVQINTGNRSDLDITTVKSPESLIHSPVKQDNRVGYIVNEDGAIEIDSDSDDAIIKKEPYSCPNNEDNMFNDTIFCNMKRELEGLDSYDGKYVPTYFIDNECFDNSQDWDDIFDLDKGVNMHAEDVAPNSSPSNSNKHCNDEASIKAPVEKLNNKVKYKKYDVPPIISPHFEMTEKTKKRRSDNETSKIEHNKKIKPNKFYGSKVKNSVKKITPPEDVKEIRKRKLKEIAEKSNPEQIEIRSKKNRTAKVKVSDGRGNFLTTQCGAPSTAKVRRVAHKPQSKPTSSTNHGEKYNTNSKVRNCKNGHALKTNPKVEKCDSAAKLEKCNNGNALKRNAKLEKCESSVALKTKSNLDKYKSTGNLKTNIHIRQSRSTVSAIVPKKMENEVHNTVNSVSPLSDNNSSLIPISAAKTGATHRSLTNGYSYEGEYAFLIKDLEDVVLQILSWKVSWFSDRNFNDTVPKLSNKPLHRMNKSFTSYSQYYNIVMPLMMVEVWNFLYKEVDFNFTNEPKVYFRIQSEAMKKKHIELDCLTYLPKEKTCKEGDVIVLQLYIRTKTHNRPLKIAVLGYVIYVNKKNLTDRENFLNSNQQINEIFCVHVRIMIQQLDGSLDRSEQFKPFFQHITSFITSARSIRSIKCLETSTLCQHILRPSFSLYAVPASAKARIYLKDDLNDSQTEAVSEATNLCLGSKPVIYLIHGPPGTGKTTVILNIIFSVIFDSKFKDKCILVTAPTNAAVDELVLRIIATKVNLPDHLRRMVGMIRIGPITSIRAEVQDYSLRECAKRKVWRNLLKYDSIENRKKLKPLKNNMDHWRRQKDQPHAKVTFKKAALDLDEACKQICGRTYNERIIENENSLLSGARIICTTLSSCASIKMEKVFNQAGKKIDCCIVDEATQSTEQDTLIPLILGVDKLILVGDPKQLPALSFSQESKAYGFGKSLFSRINLNFADSKYNPIKFLNMQYRMHPAISMFPNQEFYDGKLLNASYLQNRQSFLNALTPYLVFQFQGPTENPDEYRNQSEILCVVLLLEVIVSKVPDSCTFSVGIITPYNDQKQGIMENIKRKTFRNNVSITVNTVDSFQGRENDIIIMSCVRYHANNFLSDDQRLNVALTRARFALYIIGSTNLFKSCSKLGKLSKDAKDRNLLKNLDARMHPSKLQEIIFNIK